MTSSDKMPHQAIPSEGLSLEDARAAIWGGRWFVLAGLMLGALIAGFAAWRTTPIFEVTALLKVEGKQQAQARPVIEARAEGLDGDSQIQGEIEIIQSNQVLRRVVEALHLDIVAEPEPDLLFGSALYRRKPGAPMIEVETFEVPEVLRGKGFFIVAKEPGTYALLGPGREVLAMGTVGADLVTSWEGEPVRVLVRTLRGRPGRRFTLVRPALMDAIANLRETMTVGEKTKESNVLALTLQHPNPVRAAEILNTVLDQFNREDLERRTEGATKTLEILQENMAHFREKQLKAEQALAGSRYGAHAADLGEEAKAVLGQTMDLEKQAIGLRQRREELLRTYTANADVVTTLDQQIAKLQESQKRLENQGASLPRAQQEALRLTREVQVNQEHYSNLLNLETLTLQQLQMAKAGEIMDVRVVDRAMPTPRPVKPRKTIMTLLGAMLGAAAGIGFTILRLQRGGVVDPQVLEQVFGLPVLATIPHSDNQAALTRQGAKVKGQSPRDLLSAAFPVDIAVESLRSLRTSLHFAMVDAPNRAVMIAGAAPQIGKSFVSANFAVVLAQFGARVLLVDADLRRGGLHNFFGAQGRKGGLSEVLVGSLPWRDALRQGHGVDMISTGILPPNPSKLLVSDNFREFLTEACAAYDFVVLDVPPILAVTDAAIIGTQVGAALLLVKDGQHPIGEIRAAMQSLEIAGVTVKGFVFNDINPMAGLGYRRYTYHYGYQN